MVLTSTSTWSYLASVALLLTGRQRRLERGIQKKELQEAVKYGRRERATSGRKGDERRKFTHKSIVYITDQSMKHEITSWNIDGGEEVGAQFPVCQGEASSHTILIVDSSGSMRKNDIPGYSCRTSAVYNCLADQFISAQLAVSSGIGVGKAVVSLLEMSDDTNIIFKRAAFDEALLEH